MGSGIYLRDSDKLIVYFKVEFSNADYLFLGLQITNPSQITSKDTYDIVIRNSTGLQSSKDSPKCVTSQCPEASPDVNTSWLLRRSARLQDPGVEAFVRAHNYTHSTNSPNFHSHSQLNALT